MMYAVGLLLAIATGAKVGASPTTVPELDVTKYVGLWYQMYSDIYVTKTFEKDSYCATAQYGAEADGKLSVHNYAKIGAPNGTDYVIDGYAYGSNPEQPGQLKVHFNPVDGQKVSPFDAPYWVLELGPVNADGLYDYSIVSDNFGSFLFVLARNVATFNAKYKSSVESTLPALGFTGFKKPIPTYQERDCVYESSNSVSSQLSSKKQTAVTSLDLDAYVGYWYNVYASPFSAATAFGKNGKCATAAYTAFTTDAGLPGVRVLNSETTGGAADGSTGTSAITGTAFQPDPAQAGQLRLTLKGLPETDYWVVLLGPKNAAGQYDYAVVSAPNGITLFVLARDVDEFFSKYDTEVTQKLTEMGFSGFDNKPVKTYQGTDCKYSM
jgi:lipocalin